MQTNPENGRDGGLAVLIVEDDEDASSLLCQIIQSKGHHVRTARDADGAIAAIREGPPDIVYIDLGPAKESANELATAIRECFGDTIALIATTGYADAEHCARAKAAGFDDVMLKPIDTDALLRTLQEATFTVELELVAQ